MPGASWRHARAVARLRAVPVFLVLHLDDLPELFGQAGDSPVDAVQRATMPGRPPALGTYGRATEPLAVIKL
jgi:hypothetical protein